ATAAPGPGEATFRVTMTALTATPARVVTSAQLIGVRILRLSSSFVRFRHASLLFRVRGRSRTGSATGSATPCLRPNRSRMVRNCSEKLEAPPGFEPGMEVLQTSATPCFRHKSADLLSNCASGHVRSPPNLPPNRYRYRYRSPLGAQASCLRRAQFTPPPGNAL